MKAFQVSGAQTAVIAQIKLHPRVNTLEKPHECAKNKVPIGSVSVDGKRDDLYACLKCRRPLDAAGNAHPNFGATGIVQQAMINGQTANVYYNATGVGLGFKAGTGCFAPSQYLNGDPKPVTEILAGTIVPGLATG